MIRLSTMTSVCPDWTLNQVLEGLKKHGYQGLEPRVGWGHSSKIELDMSLSERVSVREQVEREGLVICCVATGARFATPDLSELKNSIDEAKAGIDLAADLGAPMIRTFGGPRGTGQLYGIVHRTAEAYKQVMDQAAERGVTVLLETHDEWCVSNQVRAVVERVNHPNFKVLWDIQHPQRFMERPKDTMRTIGHLTAHLHAHAAQFDAKKDQFVPANLGEGDLDHIKPLQMLDEVGYDGFFSVEVIHKPGSYHNADRVLKQYAKGFREIVKRF